MKLSKKEFERQKELAEIISEVKIQRQQNERIATEYFSAAEEATRMGQEEYANELLATQVEIEAFADDLKYLELKIRMAVISTETINRLRGLTKALATCNQLFSRGVKVNKLGEEMSKLLGRLGTARREFSDLRASLSKGSGDVYAEVFGRSNMSDAKFKEKVAEKKKALEAKIYASLNNNQLAPVCTNVEMPSANVDDIAAMIDEETRKN